MIKLSMVIIGLFLASGIARAEPLEVTAGTIKIENVIEAELKSPPKTIIYRKSKNGKSTIFIEFEKAEA